MARKTDIELILDQIKAVLQASLNAKIDTVQTDWTSDDAAAGRVVNVPHVDNNAYFLQSLNDKVANYDPFVFYRLEDIQSQGLGPSTMKNYRITVAIISSDTGQDVEIARRMFRYSRALEETIESYFAKISLGIKVYVESLAPIQFELMNSANDYRAVGVSISVGIA